MKRLVKVLPDVIITVYIALLNLPNSGPLSTRAVSLIALLALGVLISGEVRTGSLSPVRKGYVLYFVLNVLGFWLLPGMMTHLLRSTPAAFLYASLLIIAILPFLSGSLLFTEYFARMETPPAVWQTGLFKRINRNMSWLWCGLFAASLIVSLIPGLFSLDRGLGTILAFQIVAPALLLLGVGVPINKKYPPYYQKRAGIDPIGPSGRAVGDLSPDQPQRIEKEETMTNRLKIVAVNGSPHVNGSNTSLMTQMMAPFLAAEGIEVEEVFLAEKRIEFCVGCGVCLEKGRCWRQDDHAEIIKKVLDADGLILASPVYFGHVTAQMKVFLDRSLAYGHKPRGTWKPGLAVSVSAGKGELTTSNYLEGELAVYGAFPVGSLTAIAVGPGTFLGKDLVEARAADLARDLARAIKEKRQFPATERNLSFYLFMGDLVQRQKDFMRDDLKHWEESGFYKGFESYMGQTFSNPPYSEEMRKEWIKDMVSKEVARANGMTKKVDAQSAPAAPAPISKPPASIGATSCHDLLAMMPQGFNKEAAGDLDAVYQFEIAGSEAFSAYLVISKGSCAFVEGRHDRPSVTIVSPAEVWLAVSKGEMNGQAAFMSGKYRVDGDLGLLMKLGKLFAQ
jgi:multimeric flavodoxin WrbA/putative sterol carrier protein